MRRALDTLIWVAVIAAISAVFYVMSGPTDLSAPVVEIGERVAPGWFRADG